MGYGKHMTRTAILFVLSRGRTPVRYPDRWSPSLIGRPTAFGVTTAVAMMPWWLPVIATADLIHTHGIHDPLARQGIVLKVGDGLKVKVR